MARQGRADARQRSAVPSRGASRMRSPPRNGRPPAAGGGARAPTTARNRRRATQRASKPNARTMRARRLEKARITSTTAPSPAGIRPIRVSPFGSRRSGHARSGHGRLGCAGANTPVCQARVRTMSIRTACVFSAEYRDTDAALFAQRASHPGFARRMRERLVPMQKRPLARASSFNQIGGRSLSDTFSHSS